MSLLCTQGELCQLGGVGAKEKLMIGFALSEGVGETGLSNPAARAAWLMAC